MSPCNPLSFSGFKIALNTLVLMLSVGFCRESVAQLRFDLRSIADSGTSGFIDVGDVNGDSNLDFVSYQTTKNITVFLGDAKGNFARSLTYPVTFLGTFLKLADIDGDAKLDLVLHDTSNILRFMKGGGNGTFSAANTIQLSTAVTEITIADLNQDSRSDIIFRHLIGSISVMLNQSGFTYSQPVFTKYFDLLNAYGVDDFNRDGKNDLVIQGSSGTTKKIVLLIGSGDGAFVKKSEVIVPSDIKGKIAVGDINGDGLMDLVGTKPTEGGLLYVKGNSSIDLSSPVSIPGPSGTAKVVLGDLNNDSKLDLALAVVGSKEVLAFINGGNDTFPSQQLFLGTTKVDDAIIADYDKDSDLDILFPSGDVKLLINQTGAISSFSFNRTTFGVGNFITGKIVLSKAAVTGGELVQISSSAPSMAFIPRSVLIPEGQTDGYFDVTGHAIGNATISVTFNGITKSIPVTIQSNSSCSVAPLPPSDLRILENP